MTELELIQEIQKQSSDDFQRFIESVDLDEDKQEFLKIRCATDIELFAELFFPHYCTRAFNEFHRDYFTTVAFGERNVRRARAAPRGCAKSTLATLIKPIHDACYGLEKFILILSSTTPLANKKLKDIRSEIQSNDLLIATYGVRFPKKKVGESEFLVISEKGRTYFAAVGRGSEVRGIRVGAARPTKIIADDVEHSDEVYNEQVRKKTEAWYFEDVTKSGDTGTNIEFVGTILHTDSLLSKLLKNPAYQGKTYKAILSWSEREDLWEDWRKIYLDIDDQDRIAKADAFFEANKDELLKGTSVIWPEKETYLDHMKDMAEIGKRAFMKEKQNEPQGADDAVFTQFHWYREVAEGLKIESTGKIIPWADLQPIAAMDPATGQERSKNRNSADFSVIVVGFKHTATGRVFVHYDWTKVAPPTKFIGATFDLYEKYKFEKFALEINLYRNILLPNYLTEKKEREKKLKRPIHISFYEVENTENKKERIYRIEPKVTHGHIVFNKALSRPFMQMFESFPNPDSHDDAPDAVEILYNLANNRYQPSRVDVNPLDGF